MTQREEVKAATPRGMSRLDRFLFASCDPTTCSSMRVAFGALLLIYISVWLLDASLWFTDAGVLRAETVRRMSDAQHPSLLFWLPSTPAIVVGLLSVLWLQSLLLLAGCWSRFQVACIFVWLVSFQNRNPLILDGEDTVFRLLSFFMIFMPLDHRWSIGRWLSSRVSAVGPAVVRTSKAGPASAWALRLVQFEVTAIYVSTAWCKWQGVTWRDGTALYYVSRMDDLFGRFWLPDILFEEAWLLKLATWGVLAVETLLPILLWIPRTCYWGLGLGIALHLSIEYAMHLFLFEWVMIVALLSFSRPRRRASDERLS